METSLIMGKNCLREVLKATPNRILKIFTSKREDPILEEAKKYRIRVQSMLKTQLNAMVNTESHQGFIAALKGRIYLNLRHFLEKNSKKSLVLMCDSIVDPQNFGAILRAAECFGVDGVVFSKNRGVGITPVVTKVSVGASELLSLISVSNLVETMKRFQDAGYTAVVAANEETSKSLNTFCFPDKTLLILGAEEKGVQPLICRKADQSVKIPLEGQIHSLNVSQAASILLFRARFGSSYFLAQEKI